MRIYELARQLSERFSLTIKSSDLAKEMRGMPELAAIKDSIKSHASSIEEDVAERVIAIYEARIEAPKRKAAEEATERKKSLESKRREEIKLRRKQFEQQRMRGQQAGQEDLEGARVRRDQEMKRRQDLRERSAAPIPPAVQPLAPGIPQSQGKGSPVPLPSRTLPMGMPGGIPARSPAGPVPGTPTTQSQLPRTVAPAPGPTSARPATAIPGQTVPSMRAGRPGTPPPSSGPVRPVARRPGEPGRTPPVGPQRGQRGAPGKPPPRGKGLVIPEIEVMTLKTPSRRGREKGRAPAAKKRVLKTIVRDEIEIRPSKVYGLADEFRRPIGRAGQTRDGRRTQGSRGGRRERAKVTGTVVLGSMLTTAEFAEKVGISPAEIIKQALLMGQRVTINQLIDPDLCELLAQEFGVTIEVQYEGDEQDVEAYRPQIDESRLIKRPPVVTIMGHVDHGKTTLLDAYRKSNIVDQEFGSITQHIGAYRVDTSQGEIVFLDTPGHEAFSSMRARGARVTDLIVLIVSADDGIMPQTVEAISHAREADVPIIVAINKIDLPNANVERVRTELMQHNLVPESLGGETIFVEISAKVGTNLDQLLEMILLQTEILELKADPECRAEGTVIESHMDALRGAVATILISQGTLRIGDVFVVGSQQGRVRGLNDDFGNQIKEATLSHPVEVIGLDGAAEAGDLFLVMAEERQSKEIAALRANRRRLRELGSTSVHASLEGVHELVAEGKLKELKVILKADMKGSIEAISQSLQKLSNEEVKVRILHQATGGINESDIYMASASDAVVVGFNVRPDASAATLATREGIEIQTYRVIYELIEEFQKAILGMLEKRYREVEVGRVEIRQIFKVSRIGNIAGCMVIDGEINRRDNVRLVREGVIVYEGKLASLRRIKDDVTRVASGFECGIVLENFHDIKEGDSIESYKMEEIPAELAVTS
ncbi:translation initiation factor IF-2 [Candidatus Sumerlaeota bacterium]|nr:translation initiation factor IF-2 [Candidatus Sumerlaeota bacterium]